MTEDTFQPWLWFRHDNRRWIGASECALAGLLVAYSVAWMLKQEEPLGTMLIDPFLAAVLGGIGGLGAGFVFSGWYGRPGRNGWYLSVFAAVLAPSLAGGLAGTCLFPGPGTLIGAYMPLWTFRFPLTFSVWAICLVAIHLHLRKLRADSPATASVFVK